MHFSILALWITLFFTLTSANFDVKLGVCRFKCNNQCENKNLKPKIKGYYWRDFDGLVPKDALPAFDIGHPTNPKTYIGMVYHYPTNSLYTGTIVEGLNYVYVKTDKGILKLTENIQILCTKNPEKFLWQSVGPDTKIENSSPVVGGILLTTKGLTYVVRSSTCDISYTGSVPNRRSQLDYVTMDGMPKQVEAYKYEFLLYKENADDMMTDEMNSNKFFAHHYEYSINPRSIIPSFYKKIKIGSCSMTCTNQNQDGMGKYHSGLDYYWKPQQFMSDDDAFLFGKTYTGKPIYAAQIWLPDVGRDIAYQSGNEIFEPVEVNLAQSISTRSYANILSSDKQEKLKWTPSNSTAFLKMNKKNFIPGGMLYNGTEIFVGRVNDRGETVPASIRLYTNQALAYFYNNVAYFDEKFDLLTHSG